jgi:hypothetical protein
MAPPRAYRVPGEWQRRDRFPDRIVPERHRLALRRAYHRHLHCSGELLPRRGLLEWQPPQSAPDVGWDLQRTRRDRQGLRRVIGEKVCAHDRDIELAPTQGMNSRSRIFPL